MDAHVLQVHYPSDPMQPGPVYFLTPQKCAIFGADRWDLFRNTHKSCMY